MRVSLLPAMRCLAVVAIVVPAAAGANARHGAAGPADAVPLQYSVVHAVTSIPFRHSPHWDDYAALAGYNGTRATLICGTWGDPVGPYENRRWHLVRTRFGTGYLPDRYLTTPNHANEATPGEVECTGTMRGRQT